jgi:uncharacterized protein DUF1186/SEC-C motif-containing protein
MVIGTVDATVKRRNMDVTEILSQLERYRGDFPAEAVREAIAHREEIVPALLEILAEVARDPQAFASDEDLMVHIYAMYLLAQFRETRAYPLLVQIFSTPGEVAMDLGGDVVTEGLGALLASVSDGDISGMTSLVENEHANEYVRSGALEGLLTLVACGKRSRDEVMAYFRSLFHKLDRRPDFVWDALASCCADLCPEEVFEEIRQAYDDGLVSPGYISWEAIEEAVRLGKEAALEDLKESRHLITDAVEEMGWWACFDDNATDWDLPEAIPDEAPADLAWREPVRQAQPKVGRNDPCPCGSGKKFKKCCGHPGAQAGSLPSSPSSSP